MTSRRRALSVAAVAGLGMIVLSSCQAPEDSAIGEASGPTACMVTDQGGSDDRSFNQSAHAGLVASAEDAEAGVRVAESTGRADYEPNLRSMVQSGCDLTLANGLLLTESLRTVAQDSPRARFAIVDDGSITDLDNVKPLTFDAADAAFLAGYVAAGTTESGTVAAYGAMDVPQVTGVLDGFAEGIEHWNDENDDDVELLGWDREEQDGTLLGSFTDVEGARGTTEDFLADGADIVLPVAGGASVGTAEAVAEADDDDALFVWVDADGYDMLPEHQRRHQLTAVLKDITGPVEAIADETIGGGFDSEPYVGTLENGGVGIADYHDQRERVGQELSAEVAALRQQIIDGELTVQSQTSAEDPA